MSTPPLSWCAALEDEYRALHGVPALDPGAPEDPAGRLRAVHARIHARGPIALCLSGGGIRSATFALGVLQGLANTGLLRSIDYLSTVSGGGYTGGWFTTWLQRQGHAGYDGVLRALDPARPPAEATAADPDQPSPVDRVRQTCRYLAPVGGLVSADVWSLLVTLARNLFLNWLVILPLLAAALLVPRLYYGLVHAVNHRAWDTALAAAMNAPLPWFAAAAFVSFAVCMGYVVLNLVGRGGGWSQARFLLFCLAPLLLGAIAITLHWASDPRPPDLIGALTVSAAVPAGGWLLFGVVAPRLWGRRVHADGSTLRVRAGMRTILAAAAAGLVFGLGEYWFTVHFGFGGRQSFGEVYATGAVPFFLGLVLLQIAMFVGFASTELDDGVLEWWSRLGAWIAIAAIVWLSAGILVFFVADAIEAGLRALAAAIEVDHRKSSTIFALLVPLVSSLAGMASRTDGEPGTGSPVRAALRRGALPGIILVLLSSIAWADLRVVEGIEYHRLDPETACTPALVAAGTPCHPAGAGLGEVLILGAALLALGLTMSWVVPVNRFSLHGMYRQRLIRTFLGASRPDRSPNAFTGFDALDDLCVHDLRGVRPLHVINATLNAVSSTHLGRHQRQAESFTFSPLHVGNQILGYRPAAGFGSDRGGRGTGLSLGMALAVSGAAASPGMGIYSSKARAFLLTLANARLGLWFGNPQDDRTWESSEPPLGVGPLLREMLGLTTDRNPYIYLSDGGHYENLGVWEMVARRCRLILVSDAGCDPGYTLDDLANAVRRIRLDLGVPVEFPPLTFSREGQGRTNPHWAIGTIRYAAVDGDGAPDGTILYLKATLSGDESVDVRNFAAGDPTFPHDSTGNQFFDEARFESYRLLGFHTVLSAAEPIRASVSAAPLYAWGR
jgi:hypothetical protein